MTETEKNIGIQESGRDLGLFDSRQIDRHRIAVPANEAIGNKDRDPQPTLPKSMPKSQLSMFDSI